MTKREIQILKHALGYPKNYRSYYCPGEDDIETCDRLVGKGFMVKQRLSWIPEGIYLVTPAGRKALDEYSKQKTNAFKFE